MAQHDQKFIDVVKKGLEENFARRDIRIANVTSIFARVSSSQAT
jgi:hypothetical protein